MSALQCPACNSLDVIKVQKYINISNCFKEMFVCKCKNCDLGYAFPFPQESELKKFYSNYWDTGKLVEKKYDLHQLQVKSRFEYLFKYLNKNLKILDVGSGYGFIGDLVCSSVDYEIIYDCVEVDLHAVETLKGKKRVNQIYNSIEEVNSKYDLILLSHILEHFSSPISFINKISSLLKIEGKIFIEVPNSDYLFKKKNEPHLLFFTPQSLKKLIEKSGFKICDISTFGEEIEALRSNLNKGTNESILKKLLKKLLPQIVKTKLKKKLKPKLINHAENGQWIRAIVSIENSQVNA